MQALLALRDEHFAILSGDDATACRAMLAGADGVISVASNVLPRSFRQLCELARNGEHDAAHGWNGRMQQVYDFLGVESNPIPVKPLSAAHHDTAAAILAVIGKLELACDAVVAN